MQIAELLKYRGSVQIFIQQDSGVVDINIRAIDLHIDLRLKMPTTNEQIQSEIELGILKIIERIHKDAHS